jgi:hypothetical protein
MQEETFSIRSEVDEVSFRIDTAHGFPDETFYMGGYDAACSIEVRSHDLVGKGVIYISTAQFYQFHEELKTAYRLVRGGGKIGSYENDFYVEVAFTELGHVNVHGVYEKGAGNELHFRFETDQTFIVQTLADISKIAEKYGDQYGRKGQRTT